MAFEVAAVAGAALAARAALAMSGVLENRVELVTPVSDSMSRMYLPFVLLY